MANTLIPVEERMLTPDEVEMLDKRRRRGQLFWCWGCSVCSFLAFCCCSAGRMQPTRRT